MLKRVITILVVTAAFGGGYWFYLNKQQPQTASDGAAPSHTALHDGASIEDTSHDNSGPDIGGSLVGLIDQDGQKVTDEKFKGKKLLVFFGFTNCPDICPVSMAIVTEAMNQLVEEGVRDIQPVLVTVDPKRDTPEVLKAYIADYHPSFVALTGTDEDLANVQKSYKVYAEMSASENDIEPAAGHEQHGGDHHASAHYNVNHSDMIYLMDENGKYIYHFNNSNAAEDIAEYISSH